MKRPASALTRKKATSVLRRRPGTATKLERVVRRRPAAGLKTLAQGKPQCKPIAEMTRTDFAFFLLPAGKGCFHFLRGCKSSRKGYLFQHLDFNCFAEEDFKIPGKAKRQRVPKDDWLSEFFWDPTKRRLVPDVANLPERASGTAYRIEDNGGMPFVCYVRDNAVSVFRQPRDGYILDEDVPDNFEQHRLIYTEEVMTFDSPVKTWIGIDDKCQEHGNSILVHTSSAKGKCLTATIKFDEARQALQVECTDLSGSLVLRSFLAIDYQIGSLAKLVANHLQSANGKTQHKSADLVQVLCVKCVDQNGEEVAHDQPLKQYAQLTLQDATQSYAYIGSQLYSFDCADAVTAYYSMMGNSSVPYPVALTPTRTLLMCDQAEVPREQAAPHIVNEKWRDAYVGDYIGLANVKHLTPGDMNN